MSAKMADRRRRRRVKSNEDSEEYSEESVDEQEVDKASEAESVDETKEPVASIVDSEYESAEEEGTSDKKGQEVKNEIKEPSPTPQTEVTLEHGLDAEECEEINAVGEEGGVEDTADDTLIDGEVVEDGELSGKSGRQDRITSIFRTLGLKNDDDEEDEEEEEEEEDDDEEELNEEQEEWKEGERQQGDGQESQTQQKEKVLDDDEDKRNPQYIPKKGGFYEHDDRLVDEEEKEEEKEEDKDKKGNKKKLWREDNTWQHDRFNEDEQRPKSKDELVNAYGYDIRNEDDAPRARRRRRFTGPAKYTRRWNDEEAYIKTSPKWKGPEVGRRGGRARGRGIGIGGVRRGWNRFPGGNNGDRVDNNSQMGFRPRSFSDKEISEKNGDLNTEDGENSNVVRSSHSESELEEISDTKSSQTSRENILNPQNFPPLTKEGSRSNSPTVVHQSKSSGEISGSEKPVRIEVRPRGGGRGSGLIRRGGGDRRAFTSTIRRDGRKYNNENRSGDNLARSLEKLSIKDYQQGDRKGGREIKRDLKGPLNRHPSGGGNEQRRQMTVPPRLQEAAATNRPKRYSSQRQRNAPPSAGGYQRSPPPNAAPLPPRFYDHGVEYHSTVSESNYPQQMYSDAAPPSNPPPPPQTNGPMIPPPPPPQTFAGYNPQGYQEPYGIRPMASPPRIFAPVNMATGTMAAGQPVMPSPYMSPNNSLINYGPPPTNYAQYTFTPQPPPAYSSAPPPTVPTPQEFYRGGMTYYNTQSQQYPPARNHMRRPKAAIPIVPPPDLKDNEDIVEDGEEKSIDVDGPMDDSIHSSEVAVEG